MRGQERERGERGADKEKDKKKKFRRKKFCRMCANPEIKLSYKDTRLLSYFITDKGKIVSRRISGICCSHQRKITQCIKRARNIALLPFVVSAP